MYRPRILLADDHRILTDTLAMSLLEEFDVIATFSNGRELLAGVEEHGDDIDAIVLDISMPEMNGLEAAKRITAKHPRLPVIFLTMHSERPYVEEALRAGAKGYVLKRQAASDLVNCLRAVLSGRRYISPSVWQPSSDRPSGEPELLTPRQREVLQLVSEGKSGKEIAHILNISVKTVDFHKAALMDRLGVRSIAELTRYALEHLISGS